MNQELRIEHYLMQLDQYLRALPVSQRAEIITEIKSHIHEKIESSEGRGIESVLNDFGQPRAVAERYLSAKGLKPSKPSRGGRVFKWLAIGTVALFGLIFFAGLATIWYFSPVIKVDEPNGHVSLFNGFIDVNEKLGHVKVGNLEVNEAINGKGATISGEADLDAGKVKLIKIPFNSAKLEIRTSDDSSMHWNCRVVGGEGPKTETQAGVFNFNLDALDLVRCSISLPKGLASEFHGVNGQMTVREPSDNLKISLVNGKVNIKLDPDKKYDFDVKVKNGLQDFFPRSGASGAVKVQVDVMNGLVKKE